MFFSDNDSVAEEYSQMGSPAYRDALTDLGNAEKEYERIVSEYLLLEFFRVLYHKDLFLQKRVADVLLWRF
jgi:hypothetical protein